MGERATKGSPKVVRPRKTAAAKYSALIGVVIGFVQYLQSADDEDETVLELIGEECAKIEGYLDLTGREPPDEGSELFCVDYTGLIAGLCESHEMGDWETNSEILRLMLSILQRRVQVIKDGYRKDPKPYWENMPLYLWDETKGAAGFY